jgi:hypothetical protein
LPAGAESQVGEPDTQKQVVARRWWLTPIILDTSEAEIRRIMIQSQKIVHETLSQKKKITKKAEWLKW